MKRDAPLNDGSAAQTAEDTLLASSRDPSVIDDLAAEIPITNRELDVIEIYLGDLLESALPGTDQAEPA